MDHVRKTGRLPRVEPADKVVDIAKAGTSQQAGGDRTAMAANAVDYQKSLAVQFACPGLQFSQRDTLRTTECST
jgi:hypothetical protein